MQVIALAFLALSAQHSVQGVAESHPQEWQSYSSKGTGSTSFSYKSGSLFCCLSRQFFLLLTGLSIKALLCWITSIFIKLLAYWSCALAHLIHAFELNLQNKNGVMGQQPGQARRSKHFPTKSTSSTVLCDSSTFLNEWKQQIKVKDRIPLNQQRLTFTSQVFHKEPIAKFVPNQRWQIIVDTNNEEELCEVFLSWRAYLNSKNISAELICSLVLKEGHDLVSGLHIKAVEELRLLGVPCNVFYLSFDKWIPGHKQRSTGGINEKNPQELKLKIDESFQLETFYITLKGCLNGQIVSVLLNYVMNGRELAAKLLMANQTECYREEQKKRHQPSTSSTNALESLVRVDWPLVAQSQDFYPKDYIIHIDKDCEFTAIISRDQHQLRCVILPIITIPLGSDRHNGKQLLLQLVDFETAEPYSKPLALLSSSLHADASGSHILENSVKVLDKVTKRKKKKKVKKRVKEKHPDGCTSVEGEKLKGDSSSKSKFDGVASGSADKSDEQHKIDTISFQVYGQDVSRSQLVETNRKSGEKCTVDLVHMSNTSNLMSGEHRKKRAFRRNLSGEVKQQVASTQKCVSGFSSNVIDYSGSNSHKENGSLMLGPQFSQKASFSDVKNLGKASNKGTNVVMQDIRKGPHQDSPSDAESLSETGSRVVVVATQNSCKAQMMRKGAKGNNDAHKVEPEILGKSNLALASGMHDALVNGGLNKYVESLSDVRTSTALNNAKKNSSHSYKNWKSKRGMGSWLNQGPNRSVNSQSSMHGNGSHFVVDDLQSWKFNTWTHTLSESEEDSCDHSKNRMQPTSNEDTMCLIAFSSGNQRGSNLVEMNQVHAGSFPFCEGHSFVGEISSTLQQEEKVLPYVLRDAMEMQEQERSTRKLTQMASIMNPSQNCALSFIDDGLEQQLAVDLLRSHLSNDCKSGLNPVLRNDPTTSLRPLFKEFIYEGANLDPLFKECVDKVMPQMNTLVHSSKPEEGDIPKEAQLRIPMVAVDGLSFETRCEWKEFFCCLGQATSATCESQLVYEQLSSSMSFPLCEFEKVMKAVQPVFKAPQVVLRPWNFAGCACARAVIESCQSTNLQKLADIPLSLLWKWYEEPSCFGLEVKLVDRKPNSECESTTFQAFFVPYLSGMQLFGWSERTGMHENHNAMETQCNLPGQPNFSILLPRPKSDENKQIHECLQQESWREDVVCESPSYTNNGPVSDVVKKCNCDAKLIYEFFEGEKPHQRKPFSERIKQLAAGQVVPESSISGNVHLLECARLGELHPASWFAVAWYPIYRIPDGAFRAAFLTYHSLSCLRPAHQPPNSLGGRADDFMTLPVVGLLSYNTQGEDWFSIVSNNNLPADSSLSCALRKYMARLGAAATTIARESSRDKSVSAATIKHLDYSFFLSRSR